MPKKIVIVGNCQTIPLGRYLRASLPDAEVVRLRRFDLTKTEEQKATQALYEDADLIFSQGNSVKNLGSFSSSNLQTDDRASFFPSVFFSGFHPDFSVVHSEGAELESAIGSNHSSIVVAAFKLGLSAEETIKLFNRRTYEALGFFEVWQSGKQHLIGSFEKHDLQIKDTFRRWKQRGVFMHTPPHPCSFVMHDVGELLLQKAGVVPAISAASAERYLTKYELDMIVWPLYPEVAEARGRAGELYFKVQDNLVDKEHYPLLLPLDRFVKNSFEKYQQAHSQDFTFSGCIRSLEETMEILANLKPPSSKAPPVSKNSPASTQKRTASSDKPPKAHPYNGLPSHHFWMESVARPDPADIDPVVAPGFTITKHDKIVTAGSCFAQHLARRLRRQGYNYLITEPGAPDLDRKSAKRANYGVYSARYGNLYSARQFNQLVDRAYGRFVPAEPAWRRPDGSLADPFRPQIEPNGFASLDALEADRQAHFSATRQAFEEADLLIFTLGLTEAWVCKEDGAVLPLAPGVAAGEFQDDRHQFVNFSASETAADLQAAITKIKKVNPGLKVLLTVSPVPLAATYEEKHVLTATGFSKAALRVAAEETCQALDDVFYFPSYEIVTNPAARGEYLGADLRTVLPAGVNHVMRVFFKNHTAESIESHTPSPSTARFTRQMEEAEEIVCDEDEILKAARQ
ncbi:GSCFA domain-containing protein [Rhodovibrionaceae bacterium A322]